MSPSRPRHARSGFTVVEALVLLAVVLVCGAIAAVGFDRWMVHARTNEATAMLADIASKEQAFRAVNNRFIPLRGDGRAAEVRPDESAGAFYPLPAGSPMLTAVRTPVRVDDPGRLPAGWRAIGLRAPGGTLYCTYLVNAGEGAVPADLRFGAALLTGAPVGPWFYALAACNLDGRPGYPDDVTLFGVSSLGGAARAFNMGR
jgi:Tfp pilus assembly protein PilE